MKSLMCSLSALALLLPMLAPTPAEATAYVMVADEVLADQARTIVEVEVQEVEPSPGIGRPVTDYSMAVERLIKGPNPASPLVVRVLGGLLAEDTGLHVFGAPAFEPGDRALLFLVSDADGTYRLLHFMLGAFHLSRVGDREIATRHLSEAVEVELPGKAKVQRGSRDLERFRTWLVDRAGGIERPADYFLETSRDGLRAESRKFSLIANPGIRFVEFDSGGSVSFSAHQAGQPGLVGGGFADFQTGLAAWTNDPTTPIDLVYAGQTTALGGLNSFDAVNAILFDDIATPSHFAAPFSCVSGGVLAIGGPWFSGTHLWNGDTFRTAVGADIVTNSGLDGLDGGLPYISQNQRGPEMFAHELGHTLGLGHSCDDPGLPACNSSSVLDEALMRPNIHGDNRGAQLGSDDQAGIQFLYLDSEIFADDFESGDTLAWSSTTP